MRRSALLWLLGCLAVFSWGIARAVETTAPSVPPLYRTSYAVLIGIDAYQHAPQFELRGK